MKSRFVPRKVFPVDEFDCYPHVAVFREHEAYGTRRAVTSELLSELAESCNRKFAEVGAAVPLTLGHTKDDADEEDQPDVVGWAANFDVENLFDTGKKGLFADLYIRKKHSDVIEKYPHRSVELWRTKKDISPIAMLKTTPECDLPIIRYAAENDDPELYYFDSPGYSATPTNPEEKKLMEEATLGATSGVKEISAKLDALTEMFQQFLSMLQEEEGGEGDDKGDLLAPDDDDDSPMPKPDKKPMPEKKDEKPSEKEPDVEKNAAGAACATDAFVPGMSKEKDKMSRDAEVEKFERQWKTELAKTVKPLQDQVETYKRENQELREHYRRTEAEKLVKELEDKHEIDFGDEKERSGEVELFAALNKESVAIHYDRVKSKYKKKLPAKPDSAGVANVLRYARQPEQTDTPRLNEVEAAKLADEIVASGKSYAEFMRERGKK